ncbi:DMSO/TMAO reductase YedYZ, molybdopterin-dependent catalytic subunit [Nocardioides scoriae]|uniref:DMSO/TMAO reductase YedYZ, molybdopterin-dependent catalytic subunit n=1 Tax=Nocardioides scoriae TaxID=642780 RepID=A0A1H1X4F1_9ACTN|nr:molybdopterin-dependent oxidoreductase [Nocardioides scoriae]SDT04235.1 DMSO/TMAO reductase YedYZ, molybdopterin-dependent catalytic subunit [Nocardioides scoriae]
MTTTVEQPDVGVARTPPSRGVLAVAGVVAGASGIALSQATAWALRLDTSPVGAVAAVVRDATPGRLAEALIGLVGTLDKPLLLGGTVLVLLAVIGYAASWVRRVPLVPDLVFLALGGVGLAAVMSQRPGGVGAPLAVLVGLMTWVVSLRLLTGPLLDDRHGTDADARRQFLRRVGLVVVGAAAVTAAGRFAGGARRQVEQSRRLLRLPVRAGDVPQAADLKVGISPWRTPNADFYQIHTALASPTIRPEDWELRIHGLVDREVRVGYQDLVGRELTEAWVTLCCVSNEVGGDLVGNAFWSGVPVRELLARAGVDASADCVLQTSDDGWTCSTPLEALTDDRDALLAVAMNGQPLPVEHGFPVRVVVPGLYGYVSATKWVVDLEVTRFADVTAFWTERGWGERGPVKTQSRIDVPRDGESLAAGRVALGGVAWAQHTGIAKVEVQVDGGAWQEAELGGVPDDDTWVQWLLRTDLDEGDHEVVVRATDKSGYTQTPVETDVVPDGATGWDSRRFRVG